MDAKTFVSNYVEALNDAVGTRNFPPFVKEWFAPECMFHIYNEEKGLEQAKLFWTHLLPTGQTMPGSEPREVLQFPYKVESGRVYCWRQLQGGGAPRPMYGLQETQFDDRTLISEIIIQSVPEKPDVETDPRAEKGRLGRIFLQFAEVFNEFFVSGDDELLNEWCSPDIRMVADSTFHGMAVIGPHNRINQNAKFSVEEVEEIGDGEVKARIGFVNWGGLDRGVSPWKMKIAPEWKVQELHVGLEI